MMNKIKNLLFLVFLTLLASRPLLASSLNVSGTLIDAFKAQCPSVVTRHVQGSLGHLTSLMNVVMKIKEDSQCFGSSNMVEVLANYQRIYGEYEVYRNTRDSKNEIEKNIAYYTNLLSDPSLPAQDVTMIESSIFLAQSELITTDSRLSRFDSFSNNQALGASQVLGSVEGILNQMASSPACFENKSSLVGGLLSQSLLGTAAFTTPGTALALSAAGAIVGALTNFLGNFKYNQSLNYLDEVALPTALRCVAQTLSDQYCDSSETIDLIDLYRDQFGQSNSPLEGLELLSKHMGHLSHWLQEVYAGSAITSEGDLVNRERPILQAELLEKIIRYIKTFGYIRSTTFNAILNPREKSEAIAKGISSFVGIMSSPSLAPSPPSRFGSGRGTDGTLENPIFVSRSEMLLSFSLYDPSIIIVPSCPTLAGGSNPPQCASLSAYIRNRGLTLTMSDWTRSIENALKVVNETLEQVNVERARTVSVDAFSVLVRARSDLRGETSAFYSLGKIIENSERIAHYLTERGCKESSEDCFVSDGILFPGLFHRYGPQIINTRKTGELSLTILNLVKESYRPRSIPDNHYPKSCQLSAGSDDGNDDDGNDGDGDNGTSNNEENQSDPIDGDILENKSFRITSCITKLLKLAERGNDVFFQKVRDMVAYEIEARFASGEFNTDLTDVVYATRVDLVNSLLDSFNQGNSTVSLGEIYVGLESSMSITQNTFNEFMRFFDEGLETSFGRDLKKGELADLCFKVLPYLKKDDQKLFEKIYEKCQNVSMNFYKVGPTLTWADYVEKKEDRGFLGRKKWAYFVNIPSSKSTCLLRKYNRKNLLIEERRRRQKELDEKLN